MIQISAGLKALHSKDIIHLDLKPAVRFSNLNHQEYFKERESICNLGFRHSSKGPCRMPLVSYNI